jgi:hypothetical protein
VYFHNGLDTRDRLNSEFAFTTLAWNGGLRCLPQPLGADQNKRIALYEYLAGCRLEPEEVDGEAVEAAIDFVTELNKPAFRASAHTLAVASEACFSLSAHLSTVTKRLARLEHLENDSAIDKDAAAFLTRDVYPLWAKLENDVLAGASRLGILPQTEIALEARCLSPSDFGFHNAIRGVNGSIRFIDFEYAGWDDPAKLVGDFFNQVAVPVPRVNFERFADAVAALFPQPEANRARFDLLLPVYAAKWITIVLNDFLADGEKRRNFAGVPAAVQERRAQQLAKARRALGKLRESLSGDVVASTTLKEDTT